MADETKRRGFKVGGSEAASTQDRERPEDARSLDKVLRLENEKVEGNPDAYDEGVVRGFAMGQLTLGDVEGITKPEQYKIAEIGHSYLSSGKLDDAKKIFEGLLALDPYDAYFNAAVASIAQQQERYDDAEKFYARSLELNPYFATAYANRGEMRVTQGDLVAGVQDLQKAIELDPESKEPATLRARVTVQVLQEQLGQAHSLAEQAAQAGEQTVARTRAAVAEATRKPKPRAERKARSPKPRSKK